MMHFRELPISRMIQDDLLSSGVRKHFLKNEIVLFKDDTGDEVYYVEEGIAKAISIAPEGKSVFFADFEAGDIFGYYATFTKKPRTATIIAQTNLTVTIIAADAFIGYVSEEPERAKSMMFYLTSYLRHNSLRISRNNTLAATERIAAFLVFTMEEANSKTIPIDNREDLASQMDVTRETLSRVLNKMAHERTIDLQAHHLDILKADALYRIFSHED